MSLISLSPSVDTPPDLPWPRKSKVTTPPNLLSLVATFQTAGRCQFSVNPCASTMPSSLSPGRCAASIGTPSSVTIVLAYGTGLLIGTFCVNRESGAPWVFGDGSQEMMDHVSTPVLEVCRRARAAAAAARELTTEAKDAVLATLAEAIEAGREPLRAANAIDVEAAKAAGVSATLVDRLTLTDARLAAMANAVRVVIGLADPVGQVIRGAVRPNGLLIE